jgi:UDP-glucose 4-epimerase
MTQLRGASVLVTGGAGFIGSHVVDRLLTQSDVARIRVLDNLVNGNLTNLAHLADDDRLTIQVGDIRHDDDLAQALSGTEVVFHLACLGVRHSLHEPIENHAVNAEGTLRLLKMAAERPVQRFVSVSTSEVFGSAQYAPMDERHPTWPETVYGASKLAGEAYARAYWRTYGFPVVIARPFNTYGPRSHFEGDSGEVLPRTIIRLLNGLPPLIFGDGEQTRDFMHVTDTARGLVGLAESDEAVGETVNLGSGVEVTINHLCSVVAAALGREDLVPEHREARPGDVRRLLVDGSYIRSLTGFHPEVPFDRGVASLVDHLRRSSETPAEMLERVEDRNWIATRPSTPVEGAVL